jgi:HEPN domain-containing protein
MSYDEHDAARDEFYEQISRELYPEHKQQAIQEFTAERLRSFYIQYPNVMRPAVDAVQEAKALLAAQRYSPALVFSASAFELFLKATLLRPVVYGLVHHDALAELVVQRVVGKQTDIERYEGLLARLFDELAGIELGAICREGARTRLMNEAKQLQGLRDRILHRGEHCSREDAERAFQVAVAIYEEIVVPMVGALQLEVGEKGVIAPAV